MTADWVLVIAAALGQAGSPLEDRRLPVPEPIPYAAPTPAATAAQPNTVFAQPNEPGVTPALHRGQFAALPAAPKSVQRPAELTKLRALDETNDPAPTPPPPPATPPPIAAPVAQHTPSGQMPFQRPQPPIADPQYPAAPAMEPFARPAPEPSLPTLTIGEGGAANEPPDLVDANELSEKGGSWFALVVASVVLFVSLGSNLYLGWLTWSFRERCRRLANELRRLRFSGHGGDQP